MKKTIQQNLKLFEMERNIEILYAVESGSRAWGFESQDSDWDIRFIYAHPIQKYLSFQNMKKDTIERMIEDEGDLDFVGWDLRKALHLFNKGNPHMFEYLRSPIVYIKANEPIVQLQRSLERFFSPTATLYHYFHMALGNYKKYIEDKEEVSLKKYLYVVRPLLACLWVEKYNEPPPIQFQTLCDEFLPENSDLKMKLIALLEKKWKALN